MTDFYNEARDDALKYLKDMDKPKTLAEMKTYLDLLEKLKPKEAQSDEKAEQLHAQVKTMVQNVHDAIERINFQDLDDLTTENTDLRTRCEALEVKLTAMEAENA